MARCLTGTSGWSYDHWKGLFYPENLAKTKWLHFYCERFPVVEVNSSFYHLPRESTLEKWRDSTPEDFSFVLKAWRAITHYKKLREVRDEVKVFFERASLLREKLAAVLFQLPPSLHEDPPLLRSFLKLLPRNVRCAVEFRHESWNVARTFELLEQFEVAYCIINAPRLKTYLEVTAPFAYIRMHGRESWYSYGYTDVELAALAAEIRKMLRKGIDVLVFFNNDFEARAVRNAQTLTALVKKGACG